MTLIPFAETANDLHELIPADKITKGFTSKGVVEVCIDRAFTHVFGNNPYPDIFTQAAIGLSLFDNDEHRKNEKDSVGRDIDQNYDTIPKEGA